MERPGPPGQVCSRPAWTAGEETQDGDSSVSSGRLSGSSGGHKSCAPAHRPWKERPPLVLGSPQQHGESNPRLEQLREKIRAQACWQASCASLGTSMPSSTSHLLRASPPAPRRKVRKLKKAPPAPASPGFGNPSAAGRAVQDKAIPGQERAPSRVSQRQASVLREKHKSMKSSSCKREKAPRSSTRRAAKDQDSELVGVYAWRKGQALVRGLLGPPPALPRLQSKAPSGAPAPTAELGDMEDRAAESSPVVLRTPRPATVRNDPRVPTHMPNLASCDQAGSIQSAMAILQDLHQQIQAGLELAQDHHRRGGQECQQLAGRRPKGHWSAPDVRVSISKSSQGPAKGVHRSSSEWAGSLSTGQCWGASAGWESYPQRTWSPQVRNPTSQRPGSPPERPWSASARQRAGAPCKDWEASPRGRWSLLERPSPTTQRPWSASFVKKAGAPVQCRAHPWPKPAQSTSQLAPGQENEARLPPPCPKPRGFLGHPYSPASLREFMRQKALAHQQQVLEEKASAVQARELPSQRLQGVYRQQREAVRGRAGPTKAFPLVSQTTPSIVTFVPHSAPSRGQDVPGSVGSPALRWSKVTSGMVLGDQEAPGSFCLCLDRALNQEPLETGGPQEGWADAPLPMSAGSPAGPRKLQDLTAHPPRPGLCIYLGPEEAERLGTRGPLHFRYKHARLQALETMANVLKQRIDLLTANLRGADAADTLEDLPSNPPSSRPSTHSASLPPSFGTPKPVVPACPQALVPDAGRGSPWGWADVRARRLLSPSCLPDGETLLWSPGWEQRRSVSPRGHLAYSPPGSMEDGCLKLDRRLARDTASVQALGPLAGSSLEVPPPPDPTRGSLWLEEMPSARGAGLVTPWALQSCDQQEPGGPRAGHFSDLQQKSLSFLQALKLDQQKQEQALALLRQRAELEVWETQKALDELLSKQRLARRMEKRETQARPGAAPELEGLRLWAGPDPKTSWSAVTARSRSQLSLGRDAAAPSWGPEEGQERPASQSAYAASLQEPEPGHAPSPLPLARLYPWDHPVHQVPGQSPREEELLRLREEAVQGKMRWEPAWLECQRCPGSQGSEAALVLAEKQPQGLSSLEQGQRETRFPDNSRLLSCQERTLLLRHHRHILSVQRAVARLQQELLATAQLLQGSSPEAKATWEWGSETGQQPVGPAQGSSCSPTPLGPCSPSSHGPWRNPESPGVPPPVPKQDRTPPRETSASDVHLRPLRPAWGEETSMADGWVDAQEGLVESGSQMGQGDPQPNPSPSSTAETWALTESHARSSWAQGVPCSPREASVVEGSASRVGAELELDFASSPGREAPEMEGQWSEEQRTETCWQEDPHDPQSWEEATQLTTCPAPAEEARPPTQLQGSPPPQLPAPSALDSPPASVPGTCSGSSVGSHTPSSMSGLSCPSLQEFQKVSAFLVQLSDSSASLSDWEAGDTPDADLGSSTESSVGASRGLHGGGGQAACGTRPLRGSPTASGPGLLQEGQPRPLPDVPSPGSGSELSEASSEVWDEESPLQPGMGAQPAAGWPSPARGSSDLEDGGAPSMALLSPGPGGGQEASGTGGSLTSELDAGKASWPCPEAACTAFLPCAHSCSDSALSLPFPSGSSVSKGASFSGGGEMESLQTSTDCPEGPQEADRNPPRAPPATPRVLAALRAESRAPGHVGSGAPAAPEEASLSLDGSVLPELLSPVDEVLSYGSADLPSSTHRDAPPPPALPAGSRATPSPPSEDFPSPPEDASTNTWELPSLSEALSLGPQEASLCLAAQRFHWFSKTAQTTEMERQELEGCGVSGRLRKVLDSGENHPQELGGEQVLGTNHRPAEMATGQDCAISEGQEKKSGFGGSKGLRPPALSGNQWRVCASETSEAKGSCGCGAADAADSGGRTA
ncbi:coiled-coil domain-containing protein 187 [Myotis yumanensis]|uniref:coiled-coil domain-containing protein 187 n=1 Tax=Myotis yumanensis TaxID=159337 RepID=UPI0038D48DFC